MPQQLNLYSPGLCQRRYRDTFGQMLAVQGFGGDKVASQVLSLGRLKQGFGGGHGVTAYRERLSL